MRKVSLTLKETYRRLEEDRNEVYQVEAFFFQKWKIL